MRATTNAGRRAALILTVAAAAGGMRIVSSLANPVGAQVAAGSVTVSAPSPARMTIQQNSGKAIVNWTSFSIGANEQVVVNQPSRTSTMLSRVVGNDPSTIAGRLQANGNFFLVNPAGVMFARGASVNVGSMVASTLNISDADFLAGRYRFTGEGGTVSNLGSINAATGGTVALLGGHVSNDGTITARLGTVAMGAGSDITVDFAGDGLTKLRVDKGTADALLGNTGTLAADGGQVVMSVQSADALANAVLNQQGIVRAQSLAERNGRIVLDGGTSGVTQVAGLLDATGGAGRDGGRIDVTGHNVALMGGARVDASGATGGGTVRFGGGAAGLDADIRNANALWMAPTARISADALSNGDGGQVVAYGTQVARLYGTLTAKGGPGGGNGGTIETSGHYLDASSVKIDASAPKGDPGTWRVDPTDLEIVASGVAVANPNSVADNTATFAPTLQTTQLLNTSITNQLDNGTSVIVTTVGSPDTVEELGNITVNAPIVHSGNFDATLTLQAAGSIVINHFVPGLGTAVPIRIVGGGGGGGGTGKLNLVLDANSGNVAPSAINGIFVQGDAATAPPIDILTNGGNLTMGTAGNTGAGYDGARVVLTNTRIDTRVGAATAVQPNALSGSVTIHGQYPGNDDPPATYAVEIESSSITTSNGAVDIAAARVPNTVNPVGGVVLRSFVDQAAVVATAVTTGSGNVTIDGGGTAATGPTAGVALLDGSSVTTTAGGSVAIRGGLFGPASGAPVFAQQYGVNLQSGSISANAPGSAISIAGSTSTSDPGVSLSGPVTAGAGGTITVRASNDGRASSFLDRAAAASLNAPGGQLAVMSSTVDPASFAVTDLTATPISLFASGAGLSIDQTTVQAFSPALQTVILGSIRQTGLITVNGVCAAGSAVCVLTRPGFATNLTLSNPAPGSQGIAIPFGLSLPGKTLTLASAGPVTDPGGLVAAGLMLAGPGTFTLTDAGNDIGVLSMVNAGAVTFSNPATFRIGPMITQTYDGTTGQFVALDGTNSTLTGNLLATSLNGQIILGGGVPAQGGPTGGANTNLSTPGAIDLVMENSVFSNAGTGTIAANGAWRIYASTWTGETRGNVAPTTLQPNFYGCAFGAGCVWGGAVPAAGNHFVYVQRPQLTVTGDDATRQAGQPNPPFTATTSGFVNGDTREGTLTGGLSTTATPQSPPGQYPIDPAFLSNVGYVVTQRPGALTVTAPPKPTPPDPEFPSAVAGVQTYFSAREQTFVYENNLQGGANICIGSNQPDFISGTPGDKPDPLAVEWKRVRSQPNLSRCVAVDRQHGCDDF